ncbi:MAG: uroporphyrinogen-III C-methyltransferase [Pseudonocardiaceae bacterium]|nr:uroporphyrinogen-III C-methyltransferase [Pseudonocardiaceae bacterium]
MTVHLVGAGPGDPDLLTRRGAALLERAEHVVYDRPSMDAILELAPWARRHCVGKHGSTPAAAQHDIDDLLIALGRTGVCVVRLKAGDPCVVSRGGEEALALAAAGIDVELVPGVSAAVAAPAAAGIPVMVRQQARTVTVVAANDDPEYPGEVNWDALTRLGGTVVLLTGRAALRRITAALLAAGMAPGTPVAAISAASQPQQRTVRGTLAAPPDARLPPPLTVVIGDVARCDVTQHVATRPEGSRAHP